MKRILSLLMVIAVMCGALVACGDTEPAEKSTGDIVILFTNDIHCEPEGAVTLSEIAAYKKQMKSLTDNVLLVDCGDAIQGTSLGSVTKGSFMVDAMNEVGYDYAIFGNHEFDFGQTRLIELVEQANAQYLCCNVTYSGSGETVLTHTKPYEIVAFGDISVALIGVTTPMTLHDSTPANFMENSEYVYDFNGGEDDTRLFASVQGYVDEVRGKGADYVIVLSHMGMGDGSILFGSDRLIRNTNGIDAVLDGHSHETYTKVCIENKEGKSVLLAQTGTQLAGLGQLTISSSGLLSVTMIDELHCDDADTASKLTELRSRNSELLNSVVAHSDVTLSSTDENGVRAVRNRETTIGDLCADAYRAVTGADIAYVNGAGVRASLPAGDITYQDIVNVHPFGNMLCVVEVTGQEIADMLEYFVREVQQETVTEDKSRAIGESGSFPCISGMTFTVDTRIPSPVLVDENDNLAGFAEGGPRRVSDIMILSGDTYIAIDPDKTYTLASHDYMILNGGCGMQTYLAGHTVTQKSVMPDYQALITYIEDIMGGSLSTYAAPAGRICFLR